MLAVHPKALETIMPTDKEALLAEQSSRVLASYMQPKRATSIQLVKKAKRLSNYHYPHQSCDY